MATKTSPKKVPLREDEVVYIVSGFLANDGYRIRHEVPNMGQSADLVATKGRWVTFIEAKTKDWRRALDQCRAHEQVADYVCLALAGLTASEELMRHASKVGYGVLFVSTADSVCRWIAMPQHNKFVWGPQRNKLSVALRRINHAH